MVFFGELDHSVPIFEAGLAFPADVLFGGVGECSAEGFFVFGGEGLSPCFQHFFKRVQATQDIFAVDKEGARQFFAVFAEVGALGKDGTGQLFAVAPAWVGATRLHQCGAHQPRQVLHHADDAVMFQHVDVERRGPGARHQVVDQLHRAGICLHVCTDGELDFVEEIGAWFQHAAQSGVDGVAHHEMNVWRQSAAGKVEHRLHHIADGEDNSTFVQIFVDLFEQFGQFVHRRRCNHQAGLVTGAVQIPFCALHRAHSFRRRRHLGFAVVAHNLEIQRFPLQRRAQTCPRQSQSDNCNA